jgi:hypothetical protein
MGSPDALLAVVTAFQAPSLTIGNAKGWHTGDEPLE